MHATTRENLLVAMHGEAFDFAKYMLFAKRARQNGRFELANLFEKTANVQILDHFSEQARLAGLVGSEVENLIEAIRSQDFEIGSIYPEFAAQARQAGEPAGAAEFARALHDEQAHREACRLALRRLEGTPTAATPPPKLRLTTG